MHLHQVLIFSNETFDLKKKQKQLWFTMKVAIKLIHGASAFSPQPKKRNK